MSVIFWMWVKDTQVENPGVIWYGTASFLMVDVFVALVLFGVIFS